MAKSHMTMGAGGVGAADATRKSADGGLLQGLGGMEKAIFGKAAEFVDKAAEALGAGVGVAAEKAFVAAASGLEQCVQDFEGPLSFAARGYLFNSRDDVVKVYSKALESWKLPKPVDLVRGEPPHGPAQYKACPTNALTAELSKSKRAELFEALAPIAINTIARNKVKEDWESLIWKYDQAKAKLKDYVSSESFRQAHGDSDVMKTLDVGVMAPLELDLNKYIAEQSILQLEVLMSAEEAKLRAAPNGKSGKPLTFNLCFSADLDGQLTLGKPLPLDYYKSRNN